MCSTLLGYLLVLTLYSKGAGKAGKHSWVNKQKNLASVSNTLVQLWEHWMGRDFRSMPKCTAEHYAKRWAQVTSHQVLYVASANEKLEVQSDEVIRLNSSLFNIWNVLHQDLKGIKLVVAELSRRRRKGDDNDDDY
jgi:hypothetical protein